MTRMMVGVAALWLVAGVALAQDPIVAIEAAPEKTVLANAAWNSPIVVTSQTDAAKHFGADALKTLAATVDFTKQSVLIFAWRGSGGDRLTYNVLESYPEQIRFSLERGRTKDLREHTKVYAVRSNVRCRVADKAIDVAGDGGPERIQVTVTPDKPFTLPDGKTTISVEAESVYLGRGGRTGTVRVTVGDSVIDVVPRTVVAVDGHRYEFASAPTFQFGHVRESDMIFTVVDSCSLTVLSSKSSAPHIAIAELDKTLELAVTHGRAPTKVYTVPGKGKHFVSITPTSMEVSRFHPDPELGARVKINVVTNFGAKAITLDYKKKTPVTIGPETITFQSSGYDHNTRTLKVRITTVPKAAKAAATVLEYAGEGKAVGDDVAEFIRTKVDGKYIDAKLPLAALAKGEAVEVQVKGRLTGGMMAIGGETTGTIIKARGLTWELDVSAPGLRREAARLNGKTVVVTGTVQQKAGVEIATRTILVTRTLAED